MGAGADGGKAIAVLSQGMDKVADNRGLETLKVFAANLQSEAIKQAYRQKGF